MFPVEWLTNLSEEARLANQGTLQYYWTSRYEETWVDTDTSQEVIRLGLALGLLGLSAALLLAALIVPQLVQSVTTFAGRLGAYEETIRGLLVWVQNTFGIDTATAEQLVQMVGTALQNWFGGLSRSAARAAADFVSGAAGAAGTRGGTGRQHLLALRQGGAAPRGPGVSACGAAAACAGSVLEICVLPTKFSAATSVGSWWMPCSWAGKHLR